MSKYKKKCIGKAHTVICMTQSYNYYQLGESFLNPLVYFMCISSIVNSVLMKTIDTLFVLHHFCFHFEIVYFVNCFLRIFAMSSRRPEWLTSRPRKSVGTENKEMVFRMKKLEIEVPYFFLEVHCSHTEEKQ